MFRYLPELIRNYVDQISSRKHQGKIAFVREMMFSNQVMRCFDGFTGYFIRLVTFSRIGRCEYDAYRIVNPAEIILMQVSLD